MPGNIQGLTTVGPNISKRADRWLNFRFAFTPERNIRDREDSPGCRNPYNLWHDGDCIGDESLGEAVQKLKVMDDGIRFQGTKAFSYVVQGQCLNEAGAPAPGVTVELWMISVNWVDAHQPQLMGTTVADANGMYGFAVPNNVTKYKIEAYDGSRGGVTVRNLVGA